MFSFKVGANVSTATFLSFSHRCGLTNEDLNRRWSHPNRQLHPVIYHTKVSYFILVMP
jgi:hypothetical protein